MISILMPLRNSRRHVRDAILSILAEHSIPLEVVVVDDSDDPASTAAVTGINDMRVRLLRGANEGIGPAFNLSLNAARGEIIMRCDADDLFIPGRIARQVAWLAAHPDFGAVAGCFSAMNGSGRSLGDLVGGLGAGEITDELKSGVTRTHFGTFATRVEYLRSLSGCRPFFVTGEDVDLALRLGDVCRVWYDPAVAYRYRVHKTSITHCQPGSRREFFERTARGFARQREEQGTDDLDRGHPPSPPPRAPDHDVPTDVRRQIQGMLLGRAWRQRKTAGRLRAAATNLRACAVNPANLDSWRSLAAIMVKR